MTVRLFYDLIALVIFALVIVFGVPALMGFDGFELNTFARYLALGIVSLALALSWASQPRTGRNFRYGLLCNGHASQAQGERRNFA